LGFAALVLADLSVGIVYAAEPSPFAIYDDDPEHLWNRLHRTLIGRVAKDGTVYGLDDAEVLYWDYTKHLRSGESQEAANAVLDEFLDENGEELIRDPLKRAILQRDLWVLFDRVTKKVYHDNPSVLPFGRRLVAVMESVALTREEIDALPDNYALGAASGFYPSEVDIDTVGASYLPPDLLNEESGPWVRIYGAGGERGAVDHVLHADGHSLFWVYLRMAEGRDATWDYIEKLRDFEEPFEVVRPDSERDNIVRMISAFIPGRGTNIVASPKLPQFPWGTTQSAIVEQALLIDDRGNIAPTHLTLSVQILADNPGRYDQMRADKPFGHLRQTPFKLRLSRKALFDGRAGGLIAVGAEDKQFRVFRSHGFDVFESGNPDSLERATRNALRRCGGCHQGRGLDAFKSRFRIIGLPGQYMPQQGLGLSVEEQGNRRPVSRENLLPRTRDEAEAIGWKKGRYSWGVLETLWRAIE
jgi:hypothetical protein